MLKSSLLLFLVIISSFSFSQTVFKAKGGSFEKFGAFGDGFLGLVQTQKVAVLPKSRKFQYFNKKGSMIWNVEVDPYNFQNTTVWSQESNYVFFLNSSFEKGALAESKSKSFLFTVYRIDKNGKVEEKKIKANDKLSVLTNNIKNLRTQYVGSTEKELIVILTDNESKFYVIKMDENFNCDLNVLNFDWDEKLYKENKAGQPIFTLNNNKLVIIRPYIEMGKLMLDKRLLSLSDFSNVNKSKVQLDISSHILSSKNRVNYSNVTSEEFIGSYFRYTSNATIATLSKVFNVSFKDNDELFISCYYKNENKDGYVVFNLSSVEDNEVIQPNVDLVFTETFRSKHKSFYIESEDNCFITYQVDKHNISVKNSVGAIKKYNKYEGVDYAITAYLLGQDIDPKKNDVHIVPSKSTFQMFIYGGRRNSLGKYNQVLLY